MRSIDDVVEEYDWERVSEQLLAYTAARLRFTRPADAEQITQEALAQLFSPEKYAAWDPDGGQSLMENLGSRVNGLLSNLRKREKRRGIHEELDDEQVLGNAPSPEDRVLDVHEARQALDELLERVDGDEVCDDVLVQMAAGYDKPADVALRTGRAVQEIYKARRRLVPHIDAIASRLGRSSS